MTNITIATMGDSHWKERSPRWEECCRIHNWIADDMTERGVSAFVHTGDLVDGPSTPRERLAILD